MGSIQEAFARVGAWVVAFNIGVAVNKRAVWCGQDHFSCVHENQMYACIFYMLGYMEQLPKLFPQNFPQHCTTQIGRMTD